MDSNFNFILMGYCEGDKTILNKNHTQNKCISFLVILTKASMYFLIETIKQALGEKILYWCQNNVKTETIYNEKICLKKVNHFLFFSFWEEAMFHLAITLLSFSLRIHTKAISQLKSILKDLLWKCIMQKTPIKFSANHCHFE